MGCPLRHRFARSHFKYVPIFFICSQEYIHSLHHDHQAFVCYTSLLSLPLLSCKWINRESDEKWFPLFGGKDDITKSRFIRRRRWCLSRSMVRGWLILKIFSHILGSVLRLLRILVQDHQMWKYLPKKYEVPRLLVGSIIRLQRWNLNSVSP